MRRDIRSSHFLTLLAKQFLATFLLACIVVGVGYAGLSRANAAASPSRIIMYQGRLLNANSVPVSDASASISFALYDAITSGNCLWSNNSDSCVSVSPRTVTLTAGLFSEALGDTGATPAYAAIASTVFADNASVYLEVIVGGETLTPRKAMLSAPYAINSDVLDGYNTSLTGGTSSIIPVTDASGNLLITGSPQGAGVSQGSLYINPGSGVVAANEMLLGIAVGGVSKFSVDAEGDSIFAGTLNATGAITGSDFSCVDCLDFAELADSLALDATTSINLGSFDLNTSGTGALGFSSTGQVTFAGNVDATNGLDVTIADFTVGGANFNVAPSTGNLTSAGDLAVNGNDITSTGIIRLTSGGSAGLQFDSANGVVNVASADDFAVGATSLTAAFSIDESLNTLRLGDGANDTSDPTFTFYASDATNSGSLSYLDTDVFNFNGGNINFFGLGTLPALASGSMNDFYAGSTFSGTSGPSLSIIEMYGAGTGTTYSAIENATSTDHYVGAGNNQLTISGATATVTRAYGSRNRLTNTSTNAGLVQGSGYLAALEAEYMQSASATTLPTAYGVHGVLSSVSGTVTSGSSIFGEITSGAGTVVTGYGGRFLATAAGTNRYGVYAEASGGTTNFSGYFTGARVQIDGDATPDAATFATDSGELFITGDLESIGNTYFGDTTGADSFQVRSGATTTNAASMTFDALTSGTGFGISRADNGGTDFTGILSLVDQLDVGSGSTGTALKVQQMSVGNAIGLHIVQNTASAYVSDSTGNNAFVIDINEDPGTDDAVILRSDANNDGTNGTDTEFRITTQGDVYMDGVMTSASVAVGGADYAEFFRTTDTALVGRMLACQGTAKSSVKRCEPGNYGVIGVVSTDPGIIGNNTREDYREELADPTKSLVGLMGQIETTVNATIEPISVGDPISTSSITPGHGAKAHGPTRILGFALEPLSSGIGIIRVLVQPQWYGGDVLTKTGSATQISGSLAIAASTAATASSTIVDSGTLSLLGSAWSGGSAEAIGMSMKTVVSAVNDYKLSITNNAGTEVASVNGGGDLAIAGRLYPSDRGAVQRSKYIYYDGSSGSGGDFMRTNSAGWATGSYDFAEMFPSPDALVAGEVVMFGDASQQVKRSTGETYNRKIAGIVSTRPGFLAGENAAGNYPVALAGRVPTLVSTENGAINIGDPLTTSSHPGYAMKATEAGPILGYAADSFSGSMGTVIVYVNVSYYSGAAVAQGPASENSISQLTSDIQRFDTSGTLNFNGGRLLAIGSMTSANGTWKLEANGDFITSGRLIELVKSAAGIDVETYAATSRQMSVQLSGSVMLQNGSAIVKFADIDPSFMSIVDSNPTYRALVTPYGVTGALYVTNRTVDGFTITESGTASSGVSVDWLVIAFRRDHAPATPSTVVDSIAPVPNSVGSSESSAATSSDPAAESEAIVIESLSEETPMVENSVLIDSNAELVSDPVPDQVFDSVPDIGQAVSDSIIDSAPAPDAANNISTDSAPSNSESDTVESSSAADSSVTP